MKDSIAFLLSDVSRLFRRRFDERARTIGVTRPQWRALSVVSRHEGINQGGLAERLEVEPITLCRMIDRLEDAGLVERRRDPNDRRARRIFLTDKARPLIDQLRVMADAVQLVAMDGMSPDDVARLQKALETMRENLLQPEERPEVANG